MSNYTSQEIQDAVEKLVRASVRKPYGALGNRDISTTFNDLQDAASGVYILKPNAPFYTVYLGTLRLAELLAAEQATVEELIETIENTNRRVTDIDNLAPLNNARAALDALSGAAGSRNNLFQSIEDVPAFQRYEANVQRFLDESSKNSRSNGAIVPTPEESRNALAALVTSLVSQHSEILSRAGYLQGAIADYDSLSLPSLLAQGVIANTRDVLVERIEELEELTPRKRLASMRDVTLDLLAGRAAVTGLGSLAATTTFAILEGTGAAFADTTHPANAAEVTATLDGPYAVFDGEDTLDFTVDSSFSFSAPAPGSFLASVQSGLAEPYVVVAGENDEFTIDVETAGGTVSNPITLTPGAAQDTNDIVLDINGQLVSTNIVADSVLQVFRFIGVVDLDATGSGSDMDFVLPAPGTWEALGTKEGDIVRVTDSLSANFGAEYTVDVGGIAGDTITCTQLSGPGPTDEVLQEIEVGFGRTVRIRIADADRLASLDDRTAIIFPVDANQSALEGNLVDEVQSLGFTIGAQIRSRSTTAAQVASDVPLIASTQTGGAARLTGTTTFLPSVWSGLGRSDPDQPNILVAYRTRDRGDVAAGQLGLIFQVSEPVTQGVIVGDILVVRETAILADQNVQGTVTAVGSSSVTVDMSAAISGGTDLLYEVGPDLTLTSEYLDARVSGSTSQDADYTMDARGQQPIPFELSMEQQVPFHRDPGGLPVFFTLELGYFRVAFQSTTVDLSTQVAVTGGSAADKLFSALPAAAVGTAPWFLLPEDPLSLQVGDSLELYDTSFDTVTTSAELIGLELSNLLIELDPPLPTDQAAVNMSLSSTVPFGRIRLSKKNNYTVLEEALTTWLALDPNNVSWFTELQRLLNPLISSNNPTIADVNAAKIHTQELLAIVTRAGAISTGADPDATLETILSNYNVSPVEEVDVLVDTYLERGATRGIDTLLQGRFSTFFGLSAEQMSYDGAAREALRAVQRLDLPIRKAGRADNLANSQTIAEWEDPDFEFDESDVEDAEDIEIPGDFAEITPPGR